MLRKYDSDWFRKNICGLFYFIVLSFTFVRHSMLCGNPMRKVMDLFCLYNLKLGLLLSCGEGFRYNSFHLLVY